MSDEPAVLVNPGFQHTSPQGLYRPARGITVALKKREHRPTRAHTRAFARVMSAAPSVTPDEYDETACQFAGWKYNQACDRCGGSCHSFDCSGLQCHVLALLGIGIGCLTSFVMSSLAYDNGLLIPLTTARSLKAHWAVIGNNLGRSPLWNGDGHVVEGRGIIVDSAFPTGRAETMEAMGRAWGCLIANWDGRGWNAAYKIPGVNYAPAPPPWKVQPVYNPALQMRDVLNDPGKGAWVGMSDGTVVYSGPNNEKVQGGMTAETSDRAAWGTRTLAELYPRTRADGTTGYGIVATTGEKYVPKGQA